MLADHERPLCRKSIPCRSMYCWLRPRFPTPAPGRSTQTLSPSATNTSTSGRMRWILSDDAWLMNRNDTVSQRTSRLVGCSIEQVNVGAFETEHERLGLDPHEPWTSRATGGAKALVSRWHGRRRPRRIQKPIS